MQISEERLNQALVVGLKGRLDQATSKTVEDHLLRHIDAGELRIVVDLAELEFVSSIGLRVFMLVTKRLKVAKGTIAFCALTPPITQVFEIAGFLSLMPIFPTRDEAVRADA